LQLWGLFEIARPDLLAPRGWQRHEMCASRRVEIRRASPATAIGVLLHRMVVVAPCDSTGSTSSVMIETLAAERQMIVAQDMSWLTMCRIGMVMFEGWSG